MDHGFTGGGIGFVGGLQIMFIALKLTDNIAWSWCGVLSPMLLAFLMMCIILGAALVVTSRRRW